MSRSSSLGFVLKPVVFALALLSSQAFALDHQGTSQRLDKIGRAGLNEPSISAIKELKPEGWVINLHNKAVFPDTVSWSEQDTFVEVLSKLEQDGGLSISLDWNKHIVWIKAAPINSPVKQPNTSEMTPMQKKYLVEALNEYESRRNNAQAAVKAATEPVKVASLDSAKVSPSFKPVSVKGANSKVIKTEETPKQGAVLATVGVDTSLPAKPVDYVPNAKANLGGKTVAVAAMPVKEYAVTPGNAKEISTTNAKFMGYSLKWEVNPNFRTEHALTLFKEPVTDMRLILDAMGGAASGAVAKISHPNKQILVVAARTPVESGRVFLSDAQLFVPEVVVQAPVVQAPVVEAPVPVQAPVAVQAPVQVVQPKVEVPAQFVEVKPVKELPKAVAMVEPEPVMDFKPVKPAGVMFEIKKGERFEEAFETFALKHGFRVKWAAPLGLEAGSDMVFRAANMVELLKKMLPRLKREADIHYDTDYNVIVISESSTYVE